MEQNYKAVRHKVVSEIGKAKFKNNKNLDASLSSNIGSKKWWKMTKILKNGHANNLNNTPLLYGNSVITDDYARANMFNNLFVSQSTLDDSQTQLPNDGISNKLLCEAAVPITEPLCHLLNYSLSTVYFPHVWKMAHVIPIHKKYNRMLCNNYRPI